MSGPVDSGQTLYLDWVGCVGWAMQLALTLYWRGQDIQDYLAGTVDIQDIQDIPAGRDCGLDRTYRTTLLDGTVLDGTGEGLWTVQNIQDFFAERTGLLWTGQDIQDYLAERC